MTLAALAAALLSATEPAAVTAATAAADPRALHAAGQYAAAAAEFQRRWSELGRPVDGVNAVVSWRTAGQYARARGLLARVVARGGLGGDLASRAALLQRKLDQLTGALALEADLPVADLLVAIDGRPAERDGELVLVDVGTREVVVEQEGCEPFRWAGVVHPGERVRVPLALRCETPPGSVHVSLERALGAVALVDGARHEIEESDVEVRVAPGLHHVRVERGPLVLADTRVEVAPRGTARVEVVAPRRAWRKGLHLGPSFTWSGGDQDGASAGLGGGLVLGTERHGAFVLGMQVGLGNPVAPSRTAAQAYSLDVGWWRMWPAVAQGNLGRWPWSVSLEPAVLRLASRSSGHGDASASAVAASLGAVVVELELPVAGALSVRAYPLGFEQYNAGRSGSYGPWRWTAVVDAGITFPLDHH